VFLSVCEDDWTSHMETLGAAMLGDYEVFELTGEPDPETIEVSVDGTRRYDGWTYDATEKRLSFDGDQYPERGSTLTVSYLTVAECSG
jgi:hypothetical protein